jgi:transposase
MVIITRREPIGEKLHDSIPEDNHHLEDFEFTPWNVVYQQSQPWIREGLSSWPRHWVVDQSFGWMPRFRHLARDYERLGETLAGLHYVAFVIMMLKNITELVT